MKQRKIFIAAAAFAFLLSGCESDHADSYPFDNAAYIDVAETTSDSNVTFKKTVSELDRELSAVLICPATVDTEVEFAPDASLVEGYNARHETRYTMLEEKYYDFPVRTALIEAGKSVSLPLTIHFKGLDQLEIDQTYLFPVTIVSADGVSLLNGSKTVYYLVRRSSAITTAAILTDNWIEIPGYDKPGSADCVNGLTAVTYEAIVRVHDFHYAGPTSTYIEEKLSTIMGVEQHLLLRIGDTNFNAEQIQVDGSGVSLGKFPEKNSGKLLSLEEWYHIAFTYDLATGEAYIYVNGQLQSRTTVAPTVKAINLGLRALAENPEESDARQFFIGYSYDNFRQLCGNVAEVRVWSVARTREEIWRDMYDVENPSEKPELRGYWKFNEGKGNVIKDLSMYGNDAVSHTDLKWDTSIEIPQLNKQE
ncbi:DUF1735 and LamG domain-containing protein [Alistipes sp.]|uniref:DUF1735 and LamG domain-containing protein n=1 Tax=Alistipes sp. TaxID=1872444 RepID=UPI003AF0A1D1